MTGPPLVQFLSPTHTVLGLVAVLRLGLHLRRVVVRADCRWSSRSPIRRRKACPDRGWSSQPLSLASTPQATVFAGGPAVLTHRSSGRQRSGGAQTPCSRPRRRAGCRARQVHCQRDASAPSEVQSPICLPGAAEESQQDSASYLICPRPTRQRAVQGPPLTQSLARFPARYRGVAFAPEPVLPTLPVKMFLEDSAPPPLVSGLLPRDCRSPVPAPPPRPCPVSQKDHREPANRSLRAYGRVFVVPLSRWLTHHSPRISAAGLVFPLLLAVGVSDKGESPATCRPCSRSLRSFVSGSPGRRVARVILARFRCPAGSATGPAVPSRFVVRRSVGTVTYHAQSQSHLFLIPASHVRASLASSRALPIARHAWTRWPIGARTISAASSLALRSARTKSHVYMHRQALYRCEPPPGSSTGPFTAFSRPPSVGTRHLQLAHTRAKSTPPSRRGRQGRSAERPRPSSSPARRATTAPSAISRARRRSPSE